MEWSLQTGKYRKWVEQLIGDGYDLSAKGFTEIPTLEIHLQLAWEAFHNLTTSRQQGSMSMGYIPVSEIKAYYNLIGVSQISKRRLEQIQTLDRAVVDFYNAKSDKENEEPQG